MKYSSHQQPADSRYNNNKNNNDMKTLSGKFKKETLDYLESKGYVLPWEDVIKIHERTAGDPRTTLENEIDSCLTVEDKNIDEFIVDEIRRVGGKTRISLKHESHAFELEPFATVGTPIDLNWKISELNEDQLNEIKFRLKKVSDFMFEQFDEMAKDHPETDLEFIYEEFEELHSEMGALLLLLLYKANPDAFIITNR